jgi:hypothetical protein
MNSKIKFIFMIIPVLLSVIDVVRAESITPILYKNEFIFQNFKCIGNLESQFKDQYFDNFENIVEGSLRYRSSEFQIIINKNIQDFKLIDNSSDNLKLTSKEITVSKDIVQFSGQLWWWDRSCKFSFEVVANNENITNKPKEQFVDLKQDLELLQNNNFEELLITQSEANKLREQVNDLKDKLELAEQNSSEEVMIAQSEANKLREQVNDLKDKLELAEQNSSEEVMIAQSEANKLKEQVNDLKGKLELAEQNSSEEVMIAQSEAYKLKEQLLQLQNKNKLIERAIIADSQIPSLVITETYIDDKKGTISGIVKDNIGIQNLYINKSDITIDENGSFEYSTYVPASGLSIDIEVTDLAGLSSSQTVTLERNVNLATASISFDRLNPIAKPAKRNNNALALIIGVSDYENTPAKAIFADSDAMVFRDYASEKLGIPDNRIKTLVNDGADEREMLLAVQSWLSRSVKQDQTDVYVFFAGHGLASDDGQNMYLLPYDGSPELLDDTAILRDRLFNDIATANPRSVTVFLDTCYSGSTRGSEMLIAARPILLKAKESAVPEGFTVFTAAAGDETAKPLEEAKHGMFSYFLMKGMEGDADINGDKQITAGELHNYVKSNVVQQSSGTQTPELQGDENRVLVRF